MVAKANVFLSVEKWIIEIGDWVILTAINYANTVYKWNL